MINRDVITTQLLLNWITRILFFICLAALLPTLPNYLNEIGGNKSQIGIVMSAFAAGVLLSRPLVGRQIDTAGRKVVLIAGILIFVISPIFYIFIQSIPTLLPIRVFHGLGLAAFGTASITLITDAAPVQHRGAAIGYTGMINTIAFALGPIIGSFIGERWGYNVLFAFVSVLSFLCLLLSLMIKETRTTHNSENPIKFIRAIWQRKVIVAGSIILLIGLTHGGVMFYIPIFLKENIEINIGLFFAIYGTAAFFIRLLIGPLSDRIGRSPMMLFALSVLSIAVWTLSYSATSVLLVFLAALLYGVGFGAHQPTLTALVADSTNEETRGKIFSFYYGGFDLGISVAGLVLGAIADIWGIQRMFLVCSGLTFCALLIYVTLSESSLSESMKSVFTWRRDGTKCQICDQYQEISPEQAEEYFKTTPANRPSSS